MLWFASIYFVTVLCLPLVVGGSVTYRALPCGRHCPRCRADTLLLASRLAALASRLPFVRMSKRWCLSCGWLGMVRLPRPSVRLVITRSAGSAAARVIDVRNLFVDGVRWRVRLETWRSGPACYGRLLFVEPSGRLWPDASPLRGRSDDELLRRARGLSSGLLASRLRELVSD